jgi:hypothetical protein
VRYDIFERIDKLEDILNSAKRAVKMVFAAALGGNRMELSSMQMKISDKVTLSIRLTDKFGNPASVDGAPVWSLINSELGILNVSEDGFSAVFVPVGTTGSCTVQVSCDADLGEGVKTILGNLPIDLLPGEASIVVIEAGEVTPQE